MLHRNPNCWDIAVARVTLAIITDTLSHNRERSGAMPSCRYLLELTTLEATIADSYLAAATDFTEMVSPLAVPVKSSKP
jgi:hypothetical protein